MRLNRQPPVHLFSKQRPHLGGFTLQERIGGEQWTCPTGLATRAGFQPDAALRGFTLQSGGGERSCSPAAVPPDPLQTGAGASAGLTRCARPFGVDLRSIHLRFAPSPPKVPPAGFAPASIRLEGGGLNCSATGRVDLAAGLTRAPALGASPHACGVPVGLLASPTRNPAFETPHDGNFTTRGKKWSPHEDLHPRVSETRVYTLHHSPKDWCGRGDLHAHAPVRRSGF